MASKKKYYAVKCGRTPGIYETWDECKRQVMGFSSAVYKSFPTREEAEAYINAVQKKSDIPDEQRVRIYVDGSYDKSTRAFSYGMVVLRDGKELTAKQAFNIPSMADMRNVAGEIMGSMAAMQYCIEQGITDVMIYYDYEGIAKWALGEWKANKEGTQKYAAFYNSIKDKLNVEFCKVKGHSGDKYNDMVDLLAKQALGLR